MIVINSKDVPAVATKDEIVGGGTVMRKTLIDTKDTGGFGALLVTFKPGARLNFHTHTYEQFLYVVEGKGIVATKTEEKVVEPGTMVFIAPGGSALARSDQGLKLRGHLHPEAGHQAGGIKGRHENEPVARSQKDRPRNRPENGGKRAGSGHLRQCQPAPAALGEKTAASHYPHLPPL